MKTLDLYNFADDNTITAFANTISELINALETESEIAMRWFNDNEMIVNPDKFQAIIILYLLYFNLFTVDIIILKYKVALTLT